MGLIKGLFTFFTLGAKIQLNLSCYVCNLFLRAYFTLNQTKFYLELINLYYYKKKVTGCLISLGLQYLESYQPKALMNYKNMHSGVFYKELFTQKYVKNNEKTEHYQKSTSLPTAVVVELPVVFVHVSLSHCPNTLTLCCYFCQLLAFLTAGCYTNNQHCCTRLRINFGDCIQRFQ